MDELLPRPNARFTPAPLRERTVSGEKVPSRLREHIRTLRSALTLPDFFERRTKTGPLVFLAAALTISAAALTAGLYTPSYRVVVDGVDVAVVADRDSVHSAVRRVEDRASRILGRTYTLEQEVELKPQLSLKEDQVSASAVETYLFERIGQVVQTSVLTVNGQVLGATDDAEGLQAMLDSIKAPYITENTTSAEFVGMVEITKAYSTAADIRELDEMKAVLTSNALEQVDYTVQSGDTLTGIARSLDMSLSDLTDMNPDINVDKIMVGQVLTTRQAVPFLAVRTVDNVTYEDVLPFETEYVPDDTMYEGYSTVLVSGQDGWAKYNADVISLNGTEQTRVINSTDVIREATTQVVATGTKPRPRTMATGTFQWPTWGNISSYYGSRYLFGSYSFHAGIDIAAYTGTDIYAADGGKVIWSGWKDNGFGNYVVIDHENGYQTYYAHCSSLLVSTGERVYKGQLIARVGSTGRSTGPHLHFQVEQWGYTVNPLSVLP